MNEISIYRGEVKVAELSFNPTTDRLYLRQIRPGEDGQLLVRFFQTTTHHGVGIASSLREDSRDWGRILPEYLAAILIRLPDGWRYTSIPPLDFKGYSLPKGAIP